jgi:hypothetical protein
VDTGLTRFVLLLGEEWAPELNAAEVILFSAAVNNPLNASTNIPLLSLSLQQIELSELNLLFPNVDDKSKLDIAGLTTARSSSLFLLTLPLLLLTHPRSQSNRRHSRDWRSSVDSFGGRTRL